jgi:primosomal protein N' (replication factor Y)
MLLCDVAIPAPLPRPLTYEVPAHLAATAVPGARVLVPLGARRVVGVVVARREGEPAQKTKPVAATLDREVPAIPEDLLQFLRELAAYYFAPIGEVVRLALPPVEKDVAKAAEKPTLFSTKKGVSERLVLWASLVPGAPLPAKALRGQPRAIFEHLATMPAATIASLERTWKNARGACERLAAMGLVKLERRAAPAGPTFADEVPRDEEPVATPAQAEAVRAIQGALEKGAGGTFLLHGVTGSGKTEVYLRAIAAARARGKGAIVLVPEIALTPQLVARYRARFGDDVAVLHSALGNKERHQMWQRLRHGETEVAIGARSALFAPVRDVGLVVVDEEHDPSFKQEEGVRYHARDMAILRAHRASAVCVLGSATPSLETEHLVRTGRATRLALPDRAGAGRLPTVEVVDLRRIGAGPTGDKRLSLPLHRALEDVLARGEQAILFLNRRGFSPSARCEACGQVVECPSCSVALTYHKRAGALLRCHYCEHEVPFSPKCPQCGAEALELVGLGTEKLEETLALALPTARIARLDRDTASGKRVEEILAKVRAGEVDVLVGTQMVTKGHDLPQVTLVGVINADAALSIPDFRSGERAFQLMVQVAGRAGRGERAGRVLVQTYDPEHAAVRYAERHDVPGFIEHELRARRELGYPPYTRAALVRTDAVEERVAREACQRLADVARASHRDVVVTGPAPAPIARLRNRYRFRVMLRSADRPALRKALSAVDRARAELPPQVRVVLDIDPVQVL